MIRLSCLNVLSLTIKLDMLAVASSNWSTWIMMRMMIIFDDNVDANDDDDDGAGTMREVFQVGGMGQLCKLHCVCHPTFSLRRL